MLDTAAPQETLKTRHGHHIHHTSSVVALDSFNLQKYKVEKLASSVRQPLENQSYAKSAQHTPQHRLSVSICMPAKLLTCMHISDSMLLFLV